MPPPTGTALILLVAFVLPGFITVLIQERTFRRAEDPTTLDRLLRALYYSVWTYLLLAAVALAFDLDKQWFEEHYEEHVSDPAELVWRVACALLGPAALIATITRLWMGSRGQRLLHRFLRINPRHEQPTAWDFFFAQRRNAYVRATLKDGTRLLGFYGERSFAAYAKDGGDLFLERLYVIEPQHEWFGQEVVGAVGLWVPMTEVVSVEFYDPHYDQITTTAPAEDAGAEHGGSRTSAEHCAPASASSATEPPAHPT